ncbi:MAG: hypothetical protein SGJ11_15160 [Phycisphaerae bacterium]|nr:hypothetical protein [Phycisphaerae bacterium]
MQLTATRFLALSLGSTLVCCAARADQSPFATSVVSYVPGLGAATGYTNPAVALGMPERFTGEGLMPQTVTPFQPAFLNSEIVSIGFGGALVLAFDHDVLDDPANPFGIDLLVYSNAFFSDAFAGSGTVGGIIGEGGAIAVSRDGVRWSTVPNVVADGLFPTLGYLDVGPYATLPGMVPSDFTKPVDPAHRGLSMIGMGWTDVLDAYDGAGGGAGIDLALVGLASIRFVRISGPATFGISPEVDAVVDVAPAAPSSHPADLNGDGAVDAADLAILLGAWGTDGAADLDASGTVDASDLAILLGAWGQLP